MISSSTALAAAPRTRRGTSRRPPSRRGRARPALAAQRVGHVAGDDALREPLDDRGLADAGLADEHRVVLGTPGQHLHDAADLGVATDDRVELALAGRGGQVDAVLLQRLEGAPPGRPR